RNTCSVCRARIESGNLGVQSFRGAEPGEASPGMTPDGIWRLAAVILLGDIGGTHSRFAFAGSDGRPQRIKVIDNDQVADLETAIARYLEEMGVRPRAAVLAIAAPIGEEEEIALTNRAWRFRRSALIEHFGLSALRVVND